MARRGALPAGADRVGGTGAIGDRPGGFYSLTEMAALVEYAAARYVTLVPEIDVPGHTGAIFRACPELAPDGHIPGNRAPGLAIGTLDPTRAATWTFVEDVLDAVIPQFPQSACLHVGGDEAFGMADEAHAAFVERAVALVRARGRLALGWQEVARASISSEEIVQYWMDTCETSAMMDNEALREMVPAELLPMLSETLGKAEHDLPSALPPAPGS